MKRLIAYISLVATMLLSALVGLVPSFLNVNSTGEYESQHTYVYKISEKSYDISNGGTTDDGDISDQDKQTRLDETVEEIKTRLSNADVSDYTIETSGLDTINVTFKVDNDLYQDVSSYLNFSWSLKASTYDGDPAVGQDASEIANNSGADNFFESGSARIEYRDNYPYVVVDLSSPEDFKTVYDDAKNAEEDSEGDSSTTTASSYSPISVYADGEITSGDESSDEEEEATPNINKIYILNDWVDGLTIDSLINDTNSYIKPKEVKDHILFEFDATKPETFFWDYDSTLNSEDQETHVYSSIYFGGYNLTSTNENAYYGSTETDRVLAYKKANIWMHKFNSTTFDWNVTLLNENGNNNTSHLVPPTNDYLVFMNSIVWSNTLFVASLIATVIVALFLILNYGLNGLTTVVTTIALLISSIGFFNLFEAEFNIGAILCLLTLLAISIFTGAIFYKKLKDELYNGKNIKKAYQDASKKSLGIQIDITVISLILGIIAYLIPSSIFASFGSLLVIGTIMNIILNIIIVRPLTWLLCNSNLVANKLSLISVEKKKVPVLSKDEKPTYFDKFKFKSSKKIKLSYGIGTSILLVASIVAMVTFSAVRGNIYNSSSAEANSQVVVRIDERNVADDDTTTIEGNISTLQNIFYTNFYEDEDSRMFSSPADVEIEDYNYSYIVNDVTNKEYYYIINLDGIYNNDSTIYALDSNGNVSKMTMEEALNIHLAQNNFQSSNVSLNEVYNVNTDSNNLSVLIFVLIGIAINSVYLLLRYNISKTLASILGTGTILTITVGIFSLIGGAYSSIITLGLLYLLPLVYMILISHFDSEKETYKDRKKELTLFETRYEAFEYSINNVFRNVLTMSLISAFGVVSMFFATGINQSLLFLIIIGILLTLIFAKVLLLPLEKVFALTFNKIKVNIQESRAKKSSSKKKKDSKNNDDGPQEAIFVGIND